MAAYRKRKLKEELRSTWFIPLRLSIFLLVFGAVVLSEAGQSGIFQPFLYYSVATLVFLLVIEFDIRIIKPQFLSLIIFAHIVLELTAEGAIVRGAGHLTSQYSALFLLSIVSASLVYRLAGTLSVATLAALIYAFTSTTHGMSGGFFDLQQFRQTYQVNDEIFYAVFLHVCTFYLVAFISGFLAAKLRVKEGELSHTSEKLERVQLDTDDILHNLHSGLITVDNRGRIVYFNRAAEAILGISQKEVKGQSFLEVFNQRMPEFCERVLSVLKLAKPNLRSETQIISRDGRTIPLGLTTSILGDERVGIRGVIAIFQDLTLAKQMEQALMQADRLAAVGELSARIAHEIRNPLASISGSVEVLKNEIELTGENARLMLNDFLVYARTAPTHTTKVELVSVVGETIELLRNNPALPKTLTINFETEQSTVYIVADEDQVRQIVINVVNNAIEAVDDNSGAVQVRIVSAEGRPGVSNTEWVCLQIADNGCGFSGEDKDKIFEPFFSRKKGGTGLGLAIVKRCLDTIDGRIEVESTTNHGTTFTLLFKKYLIPRDSEKTAIPALNPATEKSLT
ncbi:MAG: ATP-binding protein [candidate division Zixibacteria bacterium]|nr:ATP-binding protein [candidate division Zixibacteria bacterium]